LFILSALDTFRQWRNARLFTLKAGLSLHIFEDDQMITRWSLAIGIGCALMCQIASAQPLAQIKKTSTPPVIDGNGNDPAWATANAYGTEQFFAGGAAVEPSPDLTLEWRALWDNTNLYVMAKINDDAIVNSLDDFGGPDSVNGWEDDSVEFYIDAQDVSNAEYNPGTLGEASEATYQFTALAGWTPQIADTNPHSPRVTPPDPNLPRDPSSLPNTSFTWGINSYDGPQDPNPDTGYPGRRYPQDQGMATSGPITANPAGGFDWTFEASFPWEALEETPADILARDGIFGLGVAYNDDDDFAGRDSQPIWATTGTNLWHVSSEFPDVQLVDAPAPLAGDYNNNGTVDAADYVAWRDNPAAFGGNPAGYTTWRTNFGRTAAPASGLGAAAATPEPATVVLLVMLFTAPWLFCRRRH
jgi:hypothetical protein